MENNEVVEYITKSFDLKRQGFYKPAIEMLYKALNIENNNVEILSQLAELYYLLENHQRAKNYIEKTLEIDSNHVDCLKLMKNIYISEGDYEKALEAVSKIFEISKTSENLVEKIKILNELNKFEEIKMLENLDFDFNDEILYQFAKASFKNKDYEKAIRLLEEAKNKNPENKELLPLLAEIYFLNNDFEKSRNLFEMLK